MKKLILFTLFLLCGPLAYASTLTDSLPPITVVEDTTVAALAEEAWELSDKQQMVRSSVQVRTIIKQLENGELSQEEAQETIDSLISAIYLASASYFENYKATTTESVVDALSQ